MGFYEKKLRAGIAALLCAAGLRLTSGRLPELLTRPRTAIPKYWVWFPPLTIGWCTGFLGFAKGIAACMDLSTTVTVWLFIGLIVGTVPSLFHEAGKEGLFSPG